MFRKDKSASEDWRVQPPQRSSVTRQAAMVAACIAIIAVGGVSHFFLSRLQQAAAVAQNAPETIAPKAGDASPDPEQATAVRAPMPETQQVALVAQNAPETIAPKAGDASPDA
jgi:hypothetical protein